MRIEFNNIKPYVRFVHKITLTKNSKFEHSYPYDARIFYTVDGNGTIIANGKKRHMKKGSIIFINSGNKYLLETPEDQVTYIAVNFDYTFANHNKNTPIQPAIYSSYDSRQLIDNTTFSNASVLNKDFYIEELPIIEKQLISMEKEYSTKLNFYELRLSSLITDILIKSIRYATTHNSLTDGKELSDKIVVYIMQNFNKKITNKEIAEKFNYHPNYVSSLIKDYTGLPLHQYIKNIRVTKTTDMLPIANKSISEIATNCGFYDSGHFIKCFKDIIGITPQQYRNYYL